MPNANPPNARTTPARNKLPDTGMPDSSAKPRDAKQGLDAPKLTSEQAGQGR